MSVDYKLVGQLFCALQPGEGESSMDLLPELQELHELDDWDASGWDDSDESAESDALSRGAWRSYSSIAWATTHTYASFQPCHSRGFFVHGIEQFFCK